MKVQKWTDYYGCIRLVDLEQNDKGEFTGAFICPSIGCGVFVEGSSTYKEVPEWFYDTPEQALEGIKARTAVIVEQQRVIWSWLAKQADQVQENINKLNERVANLKVSEMDRRKA